MLKFYKSFFLIFVVLIAFLTLIPSNQSEPFFPYSDKALHFISFFILIFLFDKSSNEPINFLNLSLFFCYGLFLEMAQSLTSTRSAEMLDLLADTLGLLVYFIFAPMFTVRVKNL